MATEIKALKKTVASHSKDVEKMKAEIAKLKTKHATKKAPSKKKS
jgi:cell division protein FtsB